ncbi:MAG: DUF1499 domain-containing protein [Pyrinomonadaceae bacterium]|nr:DUF1499 domain-containing protein [Pyrinomonadaceae bacterium]
MKKKLIIALIIIVVAVGAVMVTSRVFFPDNIAETTPTGQPKGLVTRYYVADPAAAGKTAAEIVPQLSSWGSSWKLVENRIEGNKAVIKAEVPVVFFTDDLEVTIAAMDNSDSVKVDVRSKSRVGKSDFGENKRHVEKFLNAMDARFEKR